MSVAMDYVSAETAAKALDFPAEILAQLRRNNLLAGNDKSIDLDDATRVVNELRTEIAPFVGRPILVSEAAGKYGFDSDSIYNWISAGWIKVLIAEPRKRIDEGDIALAKALANRRGHTAGRSVFPSKPRSGRPRTRT